MAVDLLTSGDAAKRLGLTRNALLYHAALGRVDYIRMSNGTRLFRPKALARLQAWRAKRAGKHSTTIGREEAIAGR